MYLMIYDHALHFICILTMFHAFRYVFNYVEMCVGRFGLGFSHDLFIFACHMFMHISCIRILSFLSSLFCWWCVFFLSPSLSLEIFGLGFVYLMIYHHALHFICILTMFHAFRCAFNYVEMYAGRFGLGFTHDVFIFVCHTFMHISCIYSLFSFFFVLLVMCFLSFSLSLSWIDCAWHLSTNLLRLRTLLIPSLFLLILHPLFMFDSMMGRSSRTSLRTFRDVAFIQSAMSFYRTFPTLLYPMSFGFGDRNLFVRYP